jgi:hypothetical protein
MKRVKASDFPRLRRVFTGYLHEDFLEEHGSPAAALRAFVEDASPPERARFGRELQRMVEIVQDLDFADALMLLERLGSRWRPESREELDDVLSALVQGNDPDTA